MEYKELLTEWLQRKDYVPSTSTQIAQQLDLKGRQGAKFKDEVQELLKQGVVARIKGDKICIPKEADLVSGIIMFRQSGSAFVIPEDAPNVKEPERLEISAEDTWVALHKDRVLVRIIPRKKHDRYRKGSRGRPVEIGKPQGRVIRILERSRETLAGTLKKSRLYWYVIPDDPRIIPDILVPDPAQCDIFPPPRENDKVIVRLDPWEQRHLNPSGEVIQILGETHTPRAEHEALLHQYDLDPNFPANVMEEVAAIPLKVKSAQTTGRRDMRDVFTMTIDPDDAKDFDDALSLEHLDGGHVRVGVHIADVSAYVKPGNALDREAQKRGNSTYLVGQVIPMLPHALSNGICSLVEAEDRLVKSVFLTYDKNAKVTGTEFANSVIRSNKRLTYKQAYAFMQNLALDDIRALPVPPKHQTGATGKPLADLSNTELKQIGQTVNALWEVASRLRKRRMQGGSLDLDMPETKIYVDENGYADRIEKVVNDESHQLIEEFMLSANEAVARELLLAKVPLIHRVHDKPEDERLQELRETMAIAGIETGNLTKRAEVAKMLAAVRKHPQSHTLRIAFLRSLQQACYRADADGHYGLNKTHYAHFTSPIRRYADLVVHRVLDRFLQMTGNATAPKGKVEPYNYRKLVSIAQHISLTERNSVEAERESNKVKLLEFFEREVKSKDKQVFDAVIIDVKNHGMFIELPLSGAFGLIHVSTMEDDHYRFDSDTQRLIGKRSQRVYGFGENVKVVAERVDRFKRQIDFRIASNVRPAKKAPEKRSNGKKKSSRRRRN